MQVYGSSIAFHQLIETNEVDVEIDHVVVAFQRIDEFQVAAISRIEAHVEALGTIARNGESICRRLEIEVLCRDPSVLREEIERETVVFAIKEEQWQRIVGLIILQLHRNGATTLATDVDAQHIIL